MEQRIAQRDVVLVYFPFSDASSGKMRPAVVISCDAYNALHQDVVVCAITSQHRNTDYGVVLRPNQLDSGTIPQKSLIRVDTIGRLHRSLIKKRVGTVSVSTHVQLVEKLNALCSHS